MECRQTRTWIDLLTESRNHAVSDRPTMITPMKTLALLASLILSSGLLQAKPEADPLVSGFFKKLKSGEKCSVVVYGTSLTQGGAWAVAMKDWFDQKSPGTVSFHNGGGPGQNSDWGVANLEAKVLKHRPDLVLIEFSYNDAHEKFKLPVAKGKSNLDEMVKAIRKQNPLTCIVLQVMNANWDAPNGNGSSLHRPELAAYNQNYRDYAQANHLPLLDHYPTWQKLKETDVGKFHAYIPDGTHPNKEGSLAITWPLIQTWLENSGNPPDTKP